MLMFDSLIQIKRSLIEIEEKFPILGKVYSRIYTKFLKRKLHKLDDIPVSVTLLMGIYKFMQDGGFVVPPTNMYTVFYSPEDESNWRRTFVVNSNTTNEQIVLSTYNGNMIDVSYINSFNTYETTVENNLYNFVYTSDRYEVLMRVDYIFTDCILEMLDYYLEWREQRE